MIYGCVFQETCICFVGRRKNMDFKWFHLLLCPKWNIYVVYKNFQRVDKKDSIPFPSMCMIFLQHILIMFFNGLLYLVGG